MKSKKIVTPIPKKSFLADTPPGKPSYAVSVNGAKGEEVCLADPRATRALVALMDMEAALGGAASHFGGPSAFAEIMSALHAYMFAQAHKEKRPWHELFHFVNDAGHCENGLYALKANYNFAGLNLESLKGFRSLESCLTGHGEAHLFPPRSFSKQRTSGFGPSPGPRFVFGRLFGRKGGSGDGRHRF